MDGEKLVVLARELETAREQLLASREEMGELEDKMLDAEHERDRMREASQRLQLSHYSKGPLGQSQTVLSPEASQTLLTRVLEAAGAKIVTGAVVVEWDDDEKPDLIVFADGNVRELNPNAQPDKARRIVAAAHGRPDGKLSTYDRAPRLPEGLEDSLTPGRWHPYLIAGSSLGEGTWMAHDAELDRFDGRFTWPSEHQAEMRSWWLNAHTDKAGNVHDVVVSAD